MAFGEEEGGLIADSLQLIANKPKKEEPVFR
jgi:hypothetical protein